MVGSPRAEFRYAAGALFFACMVALARPARAETLPTFSEEMHVRRATEVIVATEGEALDGVVEVLASWRGTLRPGDRTQVVGLAGFVNSSEAVFHRRSRPRSRPTFQRMILFLAREEGKLVPSLWDIGACLVVVERDGLFAMEQQMNPGPRLLLPLREDEAAMQAMVEQHDLMRQRLEAAERIEDPASRVAALEPLCLERWVAKDATSALVQVGKPALPALWRLFAQSAPVPYFRRIQLQGIIKVGGAKEAPRLLGLFHGEVLFWQDRAPGLKTMWWTGKHPGLCTRYSILKELLRAFTRLETEEAHKDVLTLQALAEAYPLFGGEQHPNNGYRLVKEISEYLEQVGD